MGIWSKSILLSLWSLQAFSSGVDQGINWWGLGSQYKDSPALGWLTITFLIFIYAIVRTVKKPLSLYLETRSKDIRRQIEEGMQARKDSEEKLKMYEKRLKSLDDEVDKMRESFSKKAQAEEKERQRLVKIIEERTAKDTKDTIRSEYERSKNNLAKEVVDEAMKIALATIKSEKYHEIDNVLKTSFINELASKEVGK